MTKLAANLRNFANAPKDGDAVFHVLFYFEFLLTIYV